MVSAAPVEATVRIGIVGAGKIGSTLTRRFAALGHEVFVANSRGPDTLADLAAATGATATSVREVAKDAGLVVVTIPEGKVPALPTGFLDAAAKGAVVIDTCNYYPQRDGRIQAIEDGMTESRWVSLQIGHTVIKAFNNIQAQHLLELGRPPGTPGRIALPVAGDNETAKMLVMLLVDELGFDSVDAGSLDESWRQEPRSPVYARDYDADGVRHALAEATPERGPEWRFA